MKKIDVMLLIIAVIVGAGLCISTPVPDDADIKITRISRFTDGVCQVEYIMHGSNHIQNFRDEDEMQEWIVVMK